MSGIIDKYYIENKVALLNDLSSNLFSTNNIQEMLDKVF